MYFSDSCESVLVKANFTMVGRLAVVIPDNRKHFAAQVAQIDLIVLFYCVLGYSKVAWGLFY